MSKKILIYSDNNNFKHVFSENKQMFENQGYPLVLTNREQDISDGVDLVVFDVGIVASNVNTNFKSKICLINDKKPTDFNSDIFIQMPLRLGHIIDVFNSYFGQPDYFRDMPEKIEVGNNGTFFPKSGICQNTDNASVTLTEKESQFICALYQSGQVGIQRQNLLKSVWEYSEGVETHTLETHVYRLRKKLETIGLQASIETIENGYRLKGLV